MLYDLAVNSFMVFIESSFLTEFSKVISLIFEPWVLFIVAVLLSVFIFLKISQKKAMVFSVSMVVSGILIKLFKEIFQRVRPENMIVAETGFSFPSGHVTASIVFLGLLVAIFCKKNSTNKKLASLISVFIVLIVAFSRIYLRVHWFTDVVGGVILGGVILILSLIILEK